MNKAAALVCLLVVAPSCAGLRNMTNTPPPPPPPWQPACRHEPVRAEDGEVIRFAARVFCSVPPAGLDDKTRVTADFAALATVAPVGVILGREEMAVMLPLQQPADAWVVNVYFAPSQTEDSFAYLIAKPGARRMNVRMFMDVHRYNYWRHTAEVARENMVYDSCKARVLDVAAAAQSPEQAQACVRAMEVIDRARGARSAEQRHAEMAALERERVYLEERGVAVMEQAENARRWEAVSRSLQRMAAPPPQKTETNCRPTFGGGMKCVTN